ncbi:type II secretion system protein M [Sinimarinibacterium thermocellulolyticum]|uniref:Type II secretion system protein M n=1 Tax=Sinimarinibacterium thermocellulolyticum TaxID=3170016 RepID=A0ABV2AD03_9GAMM
MNPRVERLWASLQQLAPRERLMVLGGTVVLVLVMLYLLAWEPVVKAHQQRAEALTRARALATRIEEAAALVRSQGAGRSVDRSTSLVAVVDRTSRSPVLGKPPSRIQPEGDREVKVWIEDVPFDNLLRWLQELETGYGIGAASAEIERGARPGLVSARLSLTRE